MNTTDPTTDPTTETVVKLPVQPPRPTTPALVTRLAEQFGATWVDEHSVQSWSAAGGDRVVLLAGDPVQFPEGVDVAAVLPELQRGAARPLGIGVVRREHEDAVARRYGAVRWPSLVFLRDGGYVTVLPGMHDWDVFQQRVAQALAMPVSRAPTVGIPVVNADAAASSCH
jgi:hydrogenase-1 operon protein HyaE